MPQHTQTEGPWPAACSGVSMWKPQAARPGVGSSAPTAHGHGSILHTKIFPCILMHPTYKKNPFPCILMHPTHKKILSMYFDAPYTQKNLSMYFDVPYTQKPFHVFWYLSVLGDQSGLDC